MPGWPYVLSVNFLFFRKAMNGDNPWEAMVFPWSRTVWAMYMWADNTMINAVYGLKNINPNAPTIREQYFIKEGFQYGNLTLIAVPESGS